MNNRVFYGEYSLAYWVELMLTKKIVLPKYQRHFVWEESDVKEFVEALNEKRFVPPVTIGLFQKDGKKQNLIIDGQQRLTSVLLAYLGLFPDKEQYKAHLAALANGDEETPDDGEDSYDNVLLWNFEKLTEKGTKKQEIINNIESGNYKIINFGLTVDDMKHSFIGFSYIVPADENPTAQQEYYSKMFRDINQKGVTLLELESRKSLYFLNDQYEGYFDPVFMEDYRVQLAAGNQQQLDFVRYLSMLAAYEKQGKNVRKVARGYRRIMEKYYEEYIFSVIEGKYEDKFGKFEDLYSNSNYSSAMEELKNTIQQIDIPKTFPSIINMDVFFFGLIYEILFRKHHIDCGRKGELTLQVEAAITSFRNDVKHAAAPGQMGHLRQRISKSLEIYSSFTSFTSHE
jgi:hypothetical protein